MGIFDRDEVHQLKRIADALWELVFLERKELRNSVVDFTLSQIRGDIAMPINGTVVGGTSTFQIGFVPATNFIPLSAGPTVTVDDALVTLTPVDASNIFTATVASTDAGSAYNVTVSGTNDKGATITHAFNVPILPLPPPPPTSITDFSLNQLS